MTMLICKWRLSSVDQLSFLWPNNKKWGLKKWRMSEDGDHRDEKAMLRNTQEVNLNAQSKWIHICTLSCYAKKTKSFPSGHNTSTIGFSIVPDTPTSTNTWVWVISVKLHLDYVFLYPKMSEPGLFTVFNHHLTLTEHNGATTPLTTAQCTCMTVLQIITWHYIMFLSPA